MDKVLIRYIDNGSSRYDGKDFLESTRKIRRAEGATGNIESGKQIKIYNKDEGKSLEGCCSKCKSRATTQEETKEKNR